MADSPDWTSWTQRAEIIGTTVKPEQASTEEPISKTLGKIRATDTSWRTLVSWTVTEDKNGILYGAEFFSTSFRKTHFRLTIGGKEKWTNIELPVATNVHFGEARLVAGTIVLLEGKSTDGSSLDMWGMVEGKEIG